MATIGTAVTLMDLARKTDPSGKIAQIVELLSTTNEILQDMLFVEGNLPIGHQTTVRTGLPSATWRLLNYGVQPSKSTSKQVTDTCGMLEAYAEVDKKLLQLNGNSAEFRLDEDMAFLEAMNQNMATTVFYGDTKTNPERFVGLAPRYATLSTDRTKSGYNIIDGGGTGSDNTSIWVVNWGGRTTHGIVPKGSTAGFQHQDLGEITKTLSDGSMLQVLRTHYQWDNGLTVRDWRYNARVANLDVSNLKAESSAANLSKMLLKAVNRIKFTSNGAVMGGRTAIYCNETVHTALDIQASEKSTVLLSYQQAADNGARILTFRGIPIRRCDAILETEARVV
ncbi:MAG: major capsid protein [Verrucomicrobiota bacterium]